MPHVKVYLVGKFLIKDDTLELDSLLITANEASERAGQTGVVFAQLYSYYSYHAPQEFDLAKVEFVQWLGKAPEWEWAVVFLRKQNALRQHRESLLRGAAEEDWVQYIARGPTTGPDRARQLYVPARVVPRVPLVRSLEEHLAGDAPVLPQPLPATWEEVTVPGIFSSDADLTKEV